MKHFSAVFIESPYAFLMQRKGSGPQEALLLMHQYYTLASEVQLWCLICYRPQKASICDTGEMYGHWSRSYIHRDAILSLWNTAQRLYSFSVCCRVKFIINTCDHPVDLEKLSKDQPSKSLQSCQQISVS